MMDRKGILEGVAINNQHQFGWTMHSLPMDDLSAIPFSDADITTGPCFQRGTFEVDEPADTFLRLDGWTKGHAYINGFNLGRYWDIGPTKTLYIPAPLLKACQNELVVFESENAGGRKAVLTDTPDLGPTN